jgi:tRNA pseudouridine38-40 synthase
MLMRYRATLAYDGTAYQGFQRQAGQTPTIQLAVEKAVAVVTGQSVTVIGAGRTDTGVHAAGQVITFDVEWAHSDLALIRAVNTQLPPDIALQDIRQHEGFHPRFDAVSRVYRYRVLQAPHRQPLLRDRAWHLYGDLQGELMQQAAALLIGEHDFATFGQPPTGESTIRRVYVSEWSEQPAINGRLWTYTIEANAFLKHMVRRVVGLLVQVGLGRLSVEDFERSFRRAQLLQAISLAPPQGLTLETVRYNE